MNLVSLGLNRRPKSAILCTYAWDTHGGFSKAISLNPRIISGAKKRRNSPMNAVLHSSMFNKSQHSAIIMDPKLTRFLSVLPSLQK